MEYRTLGKTGLKVSVTGFGCWEMGGGYGDVAQKQTTAAVNRAIDVGINCFDTAPAYGRGESERILGEALGARRKDVVLVTKCGVGYPGRLKSRDSRPESIVASLERSLKNLNTDYVDVLLIHWPDVTTPFEETMGALDDLVKQGKTRFVGESNFTLDMIKECMQTRRLDVVQGGLHMFDRRLAGEIFPYCLEQEIGVMVYGPLAFGLLAGAFTEDTEFGSNDWRSNPNMLPELFLRMFERDNFRRNVGVVEELKGIAARAGKKMPHLALRWVLSNPGVHVALVGSRDAEEVQDNLGVLDWTLSDMDRAEIDAVFVKQGVNTAPDLWVDTD